MRTTKIRQVVRPGVTVTVTWMEEAGRVTVDVRANDVRSMASRFAATPSNASVRVAVRGVVAAILAHIPTHEAHQVADSIAAGLLADPEAQP